MRRDWQAERSQLKRSLNRSLSRYEVQSGRLGVVDNRRSIEASQNCALEVVDQEILSVQREDKSSGNGKMHEEIETNINGNANCEVSQVIGIQDGFFESGLEQESIKKNVNGIGNQIKKLPALADQSNVFENKFDSSFKFAISDSKIKSFKVKAESSKKSTKNAKCAVSEKLINSSLKIESKNPLQSTEHLKILSKSKLQIPKTVLSKCDSVEMQSKIKSLNSFKSESASKNARISANLTKTGTFCERVKSRNTQTLPIRPKPQITQSRDSSRQESEKIRMKNMSVIKYTHKNAENLKKTGQKLDSGSLSLSKNTLKQELKPEKKPNSRSDTNLRDTLVIPEGKWSRNQADRMHANQAGKVSTSVDEPKLRAQKMSVKSLTPLKLPKEQRRYPSKTHQPNQVKQSRKGKCSLC